MYEIKFLRLEYCIVIFLLEYPNTYASSGFCWYFGVATGRLGAIYSNSGCGFAEVATDSLGQHVKVFSGRG